jgi:uncharacterized protein YecT (DUF1311 family)
MFWTRMAMVGVALLIGIAASGPPSMAQHAIAPESPCSGKVASGPATPECFAKAFREAAQRLNDIYTKVLETLPTDAQKELQETELLWLRFRDSNCAIEYEFYKGGSAAQMVLNACLEALSRQRADDLIAMLGYRLQR